MTRVGGDKQDRQIKIYPTAAAHISECIGCMIQCSTADSKDIDRIETLVAVCGTAAAPCSNNEPDQHT